MDVCFFLLAIDRPDKVSPGCFYGVVARGTLRLSVLRGESGLQARLAFVIGRDVVVIFTTGDFVVDLIVCDVEVGLRVLVNQEGSHILAGNRAHK